MPHISNLRHRCQHRERRSKQPGHQQCTEDADDHLPTVGPGNSSGEIVPQIGCVVCKCPLVLRQRLDKTGYFFGCYNFAKAKRCKFTLDLPEGLQLYEKARRGGRS